MDIPCTLTSEGGLKDITKAEKLVKKSLTDTTQKKAPVETKDIPPEKRCLSGHVIEDEPSRKKTRIEHKHLGFENEIMGQKLTDLHVYTAQQLLKRQFPLQNGLQ